MSQEFVFCITRSEFQAAAIVDRLLAAGFADQDITALFPDKSATRDFARSKGTRPTEMDDTGPGSVLGASRDWLIGMDVPEHAAKHYEEQIKNGGILIAVETEDADEADFTEELLKDEGAWDIATTLELVAYRPQSKQESLENSLNIL